MDLGEYQAIGSELMQLLRLENPPVAISFVDAPPRGAKKNKESVSAGCVFWIRGFKDTFYTDQRDHANCNIGSFTHGFLAPEKVSLDACVDIALFDKTGYFPASEFGGVPRMSEAPNFVAYGPPQDRFRTGRGADGLQPPAGDARGGSRECSEVDGRAHLRCDTDGLQRGSGGSKPRLHHEQDPHRYQAERDGRDRPPRRARRLHREAEEASQGQRRSRSRSYSDAEGEVARLETHVIGISHLAQSSNDA